MTKDIKESEAKEIHRLATAIETAVEEGGEIKQSNLTDPSSVGGRIEPKEKIKF